MPWACGSQTGPSRPLETRLTTHCLCFTAGHRYPWLWATTYWNNAHGFCDAGGSCDLDAFKYDVAVVRTALPVGLLVGWLGIKWESARQGYSVTSAG